MYSNALTCMICVVGSMCSHALHLVSSSDWENCHFFSSDVGSGQWCCPGFTVFVAELYGVPFSFVRNESGVSFTCRTHLSAILLSSEASVKVSVASWLCPSVVGGTLLGVLLGFLVLVALRVWRLLWDRSMCMAAGLSVASSACRAFVGVLSAGVKEDSSSSSSQVSGVLVRTDGSDLSHERTCFDVSGSRRPALPQVLLCTFKGLASYIPRVDSLLGTATVERGRVTCV